MPPAEILDAKFGRTKVGRTKMKYCHRVYRSKMYFIASHTMNNSKKNPRWATVNTVLPDGAGYDLEPLVIWIEENSEEIK